VNANSAPDWQRPPKDGLLCAMVLVPQTYARNRFFRLFDDPEYAHLRGRAKAVRGLIRELLGSGVRKAEIVETHVLEDRVLMRVQVAGLNYERTTALSLLEAALVSFAVHRARCTQAPTDDEALVRRCLEQLGQGITDTLNSSPPAPSR
jgi:hypothetical protein